MHLTQEQQKSSQYDLERQWAEWSKFYPRWAFLVNFGGIPWYTGLTFASLPPVRFPDYEKGVKFDHVLQTPKKTNSKNPTS